MAIGGMKTVLHAALITSSGAQIQSSNAEIAEDVMHGVFRRLSAGLVYATACILSAEWSVQDGPELRTEGDSLGECREVPYFCCVVIHYPLSVTCLQGTDRDLALTRHTSQAALIRLSRALLIM